MGGMLGWVALIGGLVLAGVVIFAIMKNRADPKSELKAEAGAKRLYDEAAEKRRAEEQGRL